MKNGFNPGHFWHLYRNLKLLTKPQTPNPLSQKLEAARGGAQQEEQGGVQGQGHRTRGGACTGGGIVSLLKRFRCCYLTHSISRTMISPCPSSVRTRGGTCAGGGIVKELTFSQMPSPSNLTGGGSFLKIKSRIRVREKMVGIGEIGAKMEGRGERGRRPPRSLARRRPRPRPHLRRRLRRCWNSEGVYCKFPVN